MKRTFLIVAFNGIILCSNELNNALLYELTASVQKKYEFLQQHDGLKLLPRIATICAQLQEICRESQTICKERRFALDRELAILVQLYLKQLPEDKIEQLKNIIKKYHDLQHKISTEPALLKEFSQRQKHYIELIFI